MAETFKHIILWMLHHPHWAGVITFIISAAESIAIIGTIIPGSVLMTAIGTLIGASILPLIPTTLWAIAGAIAGDSISYTLGWVFKDKIRNVWPFKTRQHLLDKGIVFFKSHGGKSVFIGRFIGPIRALVPLIAGILHMRRGQFITANVSSAILWAPVYMLPGFLLGVASLEMPSDIANKFLWLILALLILIVLATWCIKLLMTPLIHWFLIALTRIWDAMQRTPGLAMFCDALKHYREDHPRGQLGLLFCLLLLIIAFVSLTFNVIFHGPLLDFNQSIYHLFRSIRHPSLDKWMLAITMLGQKWLVLPMVFTGFIWLSYKRCFRAAWHWLLLGAALALSIVLLKHSIPSLRPPGILLQAGNYSFPSGHSTFATGLYGFAAYLIASRLPPKIRWYAYTTAIVLTLLTYISRLYLGAHWLSDIVGGALLGLIILIVFVISYQRKPSERIWPIGFLLTILFTFIMSASIYALQHYKTNLINTQPVWPEAPINSQHWWNLHSQKIPFYRTNRLGKPVQVLNVQWAGNAETILFTLEQHAWTQPKPHNWVTELENPDKVHGVTLHIKTALFEDRKPNIVLVKRLPGEEEPYILRLWDSGFYFADNPNTHLWVGTLTCHDNQTTSYLHDEDSCTPLTRQRLQVLLQDVRQRFVFKVTPFPVELNDKYGLNWNQPLIMMQVKDKPSFLELFYHPHS